MNLMEGRFGKQENASLIGIAAVCGSIFTIEPQHMYEGGNSAFISMPLSVTLGLLLFLLTLGAMRTAKKDSVLALCDYSLGKGFGTLVTAIFALTLVLSAFMLMERFVNLLHTLIFVESEYANVAFYVAIVPAVAALMGLESIARLAKCFGVFIAIIMLIGFAFASSSFEAHRLYPLLGDGVMKTLENSARGAFASLPAFIAPLCVVGAAQGSKSLHVSGCAGGIAAIVFVLVTQLAVGLVFTYGELREMYAPLFNLNTVLISEDYYLRYDKAMVFVWLAAAIITSAYYIYITANIVTKRLRLFDARPCAASVSAFIACFIIAEHQNIYSIMQTATEFVRDYGALILAAPLIIAAIIGIIKKKLSERRQGFENA